MSIEESIQQYLLWKESHTTNAYKTYRIRLEKFKQYIGSARELSSITSNDIVRYHKKMATENYSFATIAYSARILKNFFEFSRGRGYCNLSPKEIIPIRYVNKEKAVVTTHDFTAMCEVLNEDKYADLTNKLVISLLWDTGMRVSELCDLTLENLIQEEKLYSSARIVTRKTFRHNLVAWSEQTAHLLTQYLGVRLCEVTHTDYLLISPKNFSTRITARTIQRWVKAIKTKANIKKEITPHSFRHGKAHNMLDKGANMRDVCSILRHVNPQSSFHYVALNATSFTSVARKYL